MIHLNKLKTVQDRGCSPEYRTSGNVLAYVPDEFTTLRVDLVLRWNKEHDEKVHALLKALADIEEAAVSHG